jgi:hypothetical protein
MSKERAYSFGGNRRNKYWNNYVKKHGFPVVEIVHEVETRKEAVELEMKYINEYGRRCDATGQLVNITIGGDGGSLGMKQTEEHISKRSHANRGRTHTKQAKANFKAAQNRPEVLAKQAEIKKSKEWLDKQRAAKLGGKLTEQHKAKISIGLKGRVVTDEVKQKISAANSGKKRTEQQKEYLSQIRRGKPRSAKAVVAAAESNKKILLNTQTGIFYNGMKEAAESLGTNLNTFRAKMAGHSRNNTPFVYS